MSGNSEHGGGKEGGVRSSCSEEIVLFSTRCSIQVHRFSNQKLDTIFVRRLAQSVYCLATGWTAGRSRFDLRLRRKDFSCSPCVQTGSGVHSVSSTMGTRGSFLQG
jgi:hypothetical protein